MRGRRRSPPRWRRIRFPIPMRGNEVEAELAGCLALPFPIPMRGNESIDRSATGGVAGSFPIPMRGNELLVRIGNTQNRRSFRSP